MVYDAIVVGARCAGAPTSMLLARRGHRVLLCDRVGFPSDTVSNGMFNSPGPPYLQRWGLLESLIATGVPAVRRGTTYINGRPFTADYPSPVYAPRRIVLDELLVRAAVESGVELRERFRVVDLVEEHGRVTGVKAEADGMTVVEKARIVIGADGKRSTVARLAQAPTRQRRPVDGGGVLTYFDDLPVAGYEFHLGGGMAILAPSNDGLTHVSTFGATDGNAQDQFDAVVSHHPALRERIQSARRATKLVPYRESPVYARDACGPGWALVGDAGFHQGPVAGYGMAHAFRDAELLSDAIDEWLSGRSTFEQALGSYARARDEWVIPFSEWVVGSLDAWAAGRQAPTIDNVVAQWHEHIARRPNAPGAPGHIPTSQLK